MKCVVSYLTRRASGTYGHRDVEVEADVLRLGRGADSEVYLPDPRVPLHCAEVHSQPGGLFVESAGPFDLRVNGAPTNSARLSTGDKIGLGPYEIVVAEPPASGEFKLTVELVRPLGDDLAKLQARSRLSLEQTGLSKRRLSWALFVIVAALFLVLPLVWIMQAPAESAARQTVRAMTLTPTTAWDSGVISGPHKFFASDCVSCHRKPFEQVRDETCLACHGNIQQHAEPRIFEAAAGGMPACQACHKEHNGPHGVVVQQQMLCTDCHADLDQRVDKAEIPNISDFGRDHPQFRPSIVTDAAAGTVQRVRLDQLNGVKESSGLKFPHDKHLTTENGGVRGPEGRRIMKCADCHQIELGGYGMRPVDMDRHCAECHQLKFEPRRPERTVPHGKPVEVQLIIKDFYATVALEGGLDDPEAPAAVRRMPGSPLPEAAREEALSWAREKAESALTATFGKRLCGSCHEVSQAADGTWEVVKAIVADQWLPYGKFHHASHESVACESCHKARESKDSSDVLLPSIENCKGCHGGEAATRLVPSTCIMCHDFHDPKLGPMHPRTAAASGN